MKTLYQFDEHRYPTGETQQVRDRDPIPPNWTDQEPPANDGYRLVGGQWQSAPTRSEWLNRPQEISRRKDTMFLAIEDEMSGRTAFSYDFGTIQATEEDGTIVDAGVRTLQFRDTWDRSNWSNMLSSAKEQIDAGNGSAEAVSPVRTSDNARVHVTNQQARDALVALRDWGAAVLAYSWDLKDQVSQATSQADLDAIDVTTGWP